MTAGVPTIGGLKRLSQLLAGQSKSSVTISGGNISNVNLTNCTFQNTPAGFATVKQYGATGNGVTDDTAAIQSALNANAAVVFPPGTYITSAPLTITNSQIVTGSGNQTIIQATGSAYDVFQVTGSYNTITNLKTQNGLAGFRFFGKTSPCVENSMQDVGIWGAQYGLVLDGYQNTNNPCYWNNFDRILIAQPVINGVLMTLTGSGDTPNANKFRSVRVYSLGASISGDGWYVQYGRFNNSFQDCEVNISTGSNSCFRVGANANKNDLINLYTETTGSVTNVQLDPGSQNTSIINLFPQSAGVAILDNSGGSYTTFNAISTSQSAQNFFQSANIGYQPQIIANTLNSPFQTHGITSDQANSSVFMYSNNNVGARQSINKSRSTTLGNQGLCNNNDDIAYWDANASDNSHFLASAQMRASVDGATTAGSGKMPGRIGWWTMPPSGSGLLQALWADCNQNIVQGAAALATTATNGFLYIATCAGAPTGVPAPTQGAYAGRVPMVYDTVNHKFWIYDTAWKGTVLT